MSYDLLTSSATKHCKNQYEIEVDVRFTHYLLHFVALAIGKSFPSIGLFSKTFVFQNLGGRTDRKLHQDALLEGTVVIKKLKFHEKRF